jgi:uncharacterized protein involved in outer membrane biogenesis
MQTSRLTRPLAIGIASVAFIAAVLLFGIPPLLDGTRQGQALAGQLASATGQQVRIEGPVRVSLWPTPHLAIGRLKLISTVDQTVLLAVPRIDLNVSLGSLISGTYAISAITLVSPEITLPPSALQKTDWLPKLAATVGGLSVRQLTLSKATLKVMQQGRSEVVEQVTASVAIPGNSTLLHVEAAGQWRGAPLSYDLDVGAPLAGTPSLFSSHLQIGAAITTMTLSGFYTENRPDKPIEGQIEVKAGQGAALWALGSSLGLLPPAPADPGLTAPLAVTGALEVGKDGYVVRALKASLGDQTAQGSARFVTQPTPGLSVALQVGTLDIAKWPSLVTAASKGQLALVPGWVGAFDLALAGITSSDFKSGAVQLKGEVAGGQIRLSNLSFTLPGSTQVKLNGVITPKADAPAGTDLKLSAESTDLRGLLTGLGVTLPEGLDESALRQGRLTAGLHGLWTRPGFSDLTLKIDGVDVSGQLSVRADTGRYDANLIINQLDVNRYMALGSNSGWLWQLPPASLSLAFKHVRLAGQSAEAVNMSADIDPGLLTIRALDAADFGGNRFRLSGTLSPDPAKASDLVLHLSTPDFAVLRESFTPAALLLPALVASHLAGPVELSVRWRNLEGERQRLSNLSLGSDGRLDLVMTTPLSGPSGWKARLQQRETSQLLTRLAPSLLRRPDAVLGAVDLYAEGTEQEGGLWQLAALQGQIAGMSLKGGDLSVMPGTPLQVNGRLQVASASLDLWKENLVPLELARLLTGSLDVTADRLTLLAAPMTDATAHLTLEPGGKITLSPFNGHWREGTLAITGEARLGTSTALKGTVDLRAATVALRSGPRFGLSGLLDLNLDVTTSGQNSREWLANLEGSGDFSLDSGNFNGLDFAALTESLQSEPTKANLPVLLNRSGQTTLSAFGGDVSIENGIAKASQLRFRTPSASADVTAQLDLAGPTLDLSSTVQLREFERAPTFRLLLNGPLEAVVPTFEAEALAQFFKGPPAPAEATAPATDKPAAPAAETTAALGEEIKAPVPPPAADSSTTETAPPDEAATAEKPAAAEPATAPRRQARRPINRPAAVEAPAASPAPAVAGSAPPSIQELMSAMPALAPSAQAAVSEARQAATAKPPAQAPEFEGVAVRAAPAARVPQTQTVRTADGARETRTEGLIIRLPPESTESEDLGSGADAGASAGSTPAASLQDLMSRVGGE